VNHSYVSGSGKIVFHGTWTEWGRDGKQRFQRVYQHDAPHGRWVEWEKDGSLGEIWNYRKGRVTGLWTFWGGGSGASYASWVQWDDKGRKQEERFYRGSTDKADSEMWIQEEHLVATGLYKKGQPWEGRFLVRDGDGDPEGYMVEYLGGKRSKHHSLDELPDE
jgi:antitoxin component YwqK of YwqJK toxin-antitoxin module